MQKYRCTYCEYIYDPVSGDPEHNVGRYTPFDALPDDWVCPVCGRVSAMPEMAATMKAVLSEKLDGNVDYDLMIYTKCQDCSQN